MTDFVEFNVVFDGPPGPEGGRFVEVEDLNGHSFRAGVWEKREDGLWQLRICLPHHTHKRLDGHGDQCARCGHDIRHPVHQRAPND